MNTFRSNLSPFPDCSEITSPFERSRCSKQKKKEELVQKAREAAERREQRRLELLQQQREESAAAAAMQKEREEAARRAAEEAALEKAALEKAAKPAKSVNRVKSAAESEVYSSIGTRACTSRYIFIYIRIKVVTTWRGRSYDILPSKIFMCVCLSLSACVSRTGCPSRWSGKSCERSYKERAEHQGWCHCKSMLRSREWSFVCCEGRERSGARRGKTRRLLQLCVLFVYFCATGNPNRN